MTLRSLIYLVLSLVLLTSLANAQPVSSSTRRRSEHSRQSANRSRRSWPRFSPSFTAPSWTWFVACDEAAWSKVADHIGFTIEMVAGVQPTATIVGRR
jgi:hypothetical protein